MVIAESYKLALDLAIFSRNFSHAVYKYLINGKLLKTNQLKGINLDKNFPEKLPSIVEIKKAIPPICFQPKLFESIYYAIKDIFMAIICFVFFYFSINYFNSIYAKLPLIALYWIIQGTLFTAFFVIGHDCGHGSFSSHKLLNDIIGNIFHSFILAPYYPWKLSHEHHHKNTGNLEKDEVFYPVRKNDPSADRKAMLGFGFGIGWFGYLFNGYGPRRVNHFNIFHPLFVRHAFGCCISIGCLTFMVMILIGLLHAYGFLEVLIFYLVPVFIFASYLVIITFLHHNELNVPWYGQENWSFVKGQLSTIDRHYGAVHNLIHNIGTHQIHHLFTKIPHYHLELATIHFRKNFPELVRICDEPIITSFFRMFKIYDSYSVVPQNAKVFKYEVHD